MWVDQDWLAATPKRLVNCSEDGRFSLREGGDAAEGGWQQPEEVRFCNCQFKKTHFKEILQIVYTPIKKTFISNKYMFLQREAQTAN